MDCKCGIVTENITYPTNEKESLVVLRHLENQILSGVSIKRVALDRGYDTEAVHRGFELLGITGYDIFLESSFRTLLRSLGFLMISKVILLFVQKGSGWYIIVSTAISLPESICAVTR